MATSQIIDNVPRSGDFSRSGYLTGPDNVTETCGGIYVILSNISSFPDLRVVLSQDVSGLGRGSCNPDILNIFVSTYIGSRFQKYEYHLSRIKIEF